MNETTLENSIREESARAIATIKAKETLEIRKMDEAYAAEMESYRKKTEAETDTRMQQELSRLENRAVLERKKNKLQSVEQFINHTVDEVMQGIRDNPRYKQYLLDALRSTAEKISAKIEVRIKKEDLSLEKEIVSALEKIGSNRSVVVKDDATIQWGGCLILDEAENRIFINTIERIYFRKTLLIRQKVMDILREQARDDKKFKPPAVKA